MNRHAIFGILTCLTLVILATPCFAQKEGAVEIGFDGGVLIQKPEGGSSLTSIHLPFQNLRIGAWIDDKMAIEPNFNLIHADVGDFTLTQLELGASMVFHLADPIEGTIPFVLLGPRLVLVDSSESESLSQVGLGGGFGVKTAFADRLRLRVQASVFHYLENLGDGLGAHTDFSVAFGFSFFVM